MNANKYILFDTETENLNLKSTRPWQLAYLVFNNGKVIDKKSYYIWWEDLNISKEAAEITKFNYDIYKKNAQPPEVVWKEFSKYYCNEDYLIVGHNILGFDMPVVRNWARQIKKYYDWSSELKRYVDTNLLYKAVKLNMQIDKNNFLNFQFKVRSIRARIKTNLTTACQENGIDIDTSKTHEALYDVEKNAEFFEKIKYLIK